VNRTDIYRQAIKRTFADLYSVARHEVDVSWNKDGDNITVRCADKTFTHETIHDDDDGALEFVSTHEEPITVRLTNVFGLNRWTWIALTDSKNRTI
jgi:hypothetical protein